MLAARPVRRSVSVVESAALVVLVLCGLAGQGACARASEAAPVEVVAVGNAPGPAVPSRRAQTVPVTAPDDSSTRRDFGAFWADFRQAVVRRDRGSIVAMTRFPFRTRGEMDESPEKACDRAGFERILDSLLSQDAGLSREPEPMSDYVRRLERAPAGAVQGDLARVGPFEFQRIDGRWLWVKSYVSE